MSKGLKVIFGAAVFGSYTTEQIQEFLDTLTKHGVKDLDAASIYISGGEKALGDNKAPSKFFIHTKTSGSGPGSLKRELVLSSAKQSLADLGVDSVETYFLQSPDDETPIEETVDAIQELYTQGKFKYFGISNYQIEDVQRIYDYAASKNYVLPSVFQGNYNALARRFDDTLLPLLRKLHMSFYAYSPMAGGFLAKSPEAFKSGGGQGRWDPKRPLGKTYQDRYNKPSLIAALTEWEAIANEAGITKAALAYRWVAWNSILCAEHGDAIIVGASPGKQLGETLKALEDGPLEAAVVEKIEWIWDLVKDEAPLDIYH